MKHITIPYQSFKEIIIGSFVDSLCGAGGYGLLTDYVADMRDEGLSLATAAAAR